MSHYLKVVILTCSIVTSFLSAIAVAEGSQYALDEKIIGLLKKKDFRAALPLVESKLNAYKTKGINSIAYAEDLSSAAKLCAELGKDEKAEQYHAKRLQVLDLCVGCENTKYHNAVRDFAFFYKHIGENDKALDLLHGHTEAVKKVAGPKSSEHAHAIAVLADFMYDENRYDEAYKAYNSAVNILRETEETCVPIIRNLNNLASCCKRLNNYREAEAIYSEVLNLIDGAPEGAIDPLGAAAVLNNIGVFYQDYRDFDNAETVLKWALELSKTKEKSAVYTSSLTLLAMVLGEKGNAVDALPLFQQALQLSRELDGPESLDYACALDNLSSAYYALKEYDKALELIAQSADIIKRSAGEENVDYAIAIDNYACFLSASKEYSAAEQKSKTAMGIFERLLGDHHPEVARCWSNYAGILCLLGRHDEAVLYKEKALTVLEAMRAQTPSEHYRITFMDNISHIYEQTAAIYHKLGHDEKAYETAERRRAKSLLELLASRQYKGRHYDNSVMNAIEAEIGGIWEQQRQDSSGNTIRGIAKVSEEKVTSLEEQKSNLIRQRAQVNPELASLDQVEPPKLGEIQNFLPPDCILLEYFHPGKYTFSDGDMNELWIFAISRDRFSLTPFVISQEDLYERITEYVSYFTDGPKPGYEQAAERLYECLLKPVQDKITLFKTVILVPWKTMCYVPFAALTPLGEKPLGSGKSIVICPSAGIYRYISLKRSSDHEAIFVVGNPKTDYAPLPGAEAEAKAVAGLFTRSSIIVHEQASETVVKSTDFSGENVAHFACHGLFDEAHPQLSCLLLTPDSENDGRLEVHEVFDLSLQGVSLVTLSACSSGKSSVGNGEEIIGLTRGFIFAGAPSVLCTLWPVADETTNTFMQAFYKAYTCGMSKSKSLQVAQETLAADPKYQHPYFWAPFVLWGDWQ